MLDSRKYLSLLCLNAALAGCLGETPGSDSDEPEVAAAEQALGPVTHYDRFVFGGNIFSEGFNYQTTQDCSKNYMRSGKPATQWTSQAGGHCEFVDWANPSNPFDCHAKIHAQTGGGGFGGTCESWVFEEAVNLAAKRVATQSSTDFGGDAWRAVDGITDGNFFDSSVTHTTSQFQPWWQVDLGSAINIGRVVLYNRTDCCSDRLSNFDLQISSNGTTWQTISSYPTTPPNPLTLTMDVTARFVRVRLRGTGILSLAEVQVFAP